MKLPADGIGGIVFPKADVYIRPKKGTAVFVSYKGVDDVMDDGYTEYYDCAPYLHHLTKPSN